MPQAATEPIVRRSRPVVVIALIAVVVVCVLALRVALRNQSPHYLAYHGELDVTAYDCDALLSVGFVGGQSKEYGGMPVLGWAAVGNHPELVEEILATCPESADWDRAIFGAIGSGSDEAAMVLADAGVGVEISNDLGRRPIEQAAMLQKWPLVEVLLTHEPDMNARLHHGRLVGAVALHAYRRDQPQTDLARRVLVEAHRRGLNFDLPWQTDTEQSLREFLQSRDPEIFDLHPQLLD